MSRCLWRAAGTVACILAATTLICPASAQQAAGEHVIVLRTQQGAPDVSANHAELLLQAASRWLRVSHRPLPVIVVIRDCPDCPSLIRGRKEERPVLQRVHTDDKVHLFLLWYRDTPSDGSLAMTLTQALAADFEMELDEAELARCAKHALAELQAVISTAELRQ